MPDSSTPARRRVPRVAMLLALALAGGGGFAWYRLPARAAPEAPARAEHVAVPVKVAQAEKRDVPVELDAIGTVQASNTIAIRSRVDGTLQSVDFDEGQEVHAGDVLARIDPRVYQAALDQAKAQKAKDEAQLRSASADLARYTSLVQKDYASKQSVDQQQATVDQIKAAISADEAAIESAQTTLGYTTITAPTDGRMGIRQIDAGNIVHASDTTAIATLATLKPIAVLFTSPEKNLDALQAAMRAGAVTVTAYAKQDSSTPLGTGRLTVIDNQIDQTTGTIRLKAVFPNDDEKLWPGAFVRVRVAMSVRRDSVTIPVAAVQRGPDGLYAWVVDEGSTVRMRPIETGSMSNGVAVVLNGLSPGDRVVTEGQYKLRPDSRVAVADPGSERTAEAAAPAAPATGSRP
ncbi:efflux RND transporter periplasmic adaptor subunit [Bosea sp. 117]|uniref:efflux RND transporter periplasmic adaptor subunit n=1 Tax=Bosea sp. 117 TaxID=1125973 RepID=UPI0018CC5DD3|nr:efflux RND transporter periplasmic adaptor subunit [Bosea sp. 117]